MSSLRYILALLILFSHCLHAKKAEFTISSFGLPIASLSMTVSESEILVLTNTKKGNPLVPKLDNRYKVTLGENWLPITYYREINQKDLKYNVREDYLHKSGTAYLKMDSERSSIKFNIRNESRDIFSFLAYLSAGHFTETDYHIDANGCPWLAHVSNPQNEVIRTSLGRFNCTKLNISFKPLSNKATTYIDMVTFNFVNESTKATVWIGKNGIPLKAIVDKGGVKMKWDINKITL